VDEPQRATLLENSSRGELVGRGRGSAGVDVGKACREPEVGLTEDCCRASELARGDREPPQPLHDRLRNRAWGEARDAGGRRRRWLDPLVNDRPHQFLDEERNSARCVMTRSGESWVHLVPESRPYELGNRPLAQRCERE